MANMTEKESQLSLLLENRAFRAWLSLIGIVVGVFLAYSAAGTFFGTGATGKVESISSEDRATFLQLTGLKPSRLPALRSSLDEVIDYLQLERGTKISPAKGPDDGAAENTNPLSKIPSPGGKAGAGQEKASPNQPKVYGYSVKTDKIGKYAPVSISFDGDIYVQIDFLRALEEKFSQILYIDAVKGTSSGVTIEARVYGE